MLTGSKVSSPTRTRTEGLYMELDRLVYQTQTFPVIWWRYKIQSDSQSQKLVGLTLHIIQEHHGLCDRKSRRAVPSAFFIYFIEKTSHLLWQPSIDI